MQSDHDLRSASPGGARPDDGAQARQLLALAAGYQISQCIHVAARLRLCDLLVKAPATVDALAAMTSSHAPSLRRLLRALAAFEIVDEDNAGKFRLLPLGQRLCAEDPQSIRDVVLLITGDNYWRTWGELGHCIATGETGFRPAFGVGSSFEYYAGHPQEAARLNDAMSAGWTALAGKIVASYDFSAARIIVDVGGGHGELLSAIIAANAGPRGILIDLPHVIAGATQTFAAAGVADRCEAVACDFRTSALPAGDLLILSRVLHDWDDAAAIDLLRRCRIAMTRDARLIVIERLLPQRPIPTPAVQEQMLSDINMMVRTGGCERTQAEYVALFEAAGLRLSRVVPTPGPHTIIESMLA